MMLFLQFVGEIDNQNAIRTGYADQHQHAHGRERKESLQRVRNIGLDIFRRHPRIEGRNHNFGKVDGRK